MVCPLQASGLIIGFLKTGRTGKTFLKPLNVAIESTFANFKNFKNLHRHMKKKHNFFINKTESGKPRTNQRFWIHKKNKIQRS